MPGPEIRTDIIDVYAFRRVGASTRRAAALEFLQLRRTTPPLAGSWQPVMGHVEPGETALQAAWRELAEEAAFTGPKICAAWQLEIVNTFFLASLNCIIHSPGFAIEIAPDAEPVLDASHDAFRWVPRDHVDRCFMWPGQRAAIQHIVTDLLDPNSLSHAALRLELP